MTTAHRPTFFSRIGGGNSVSGHALTVTGFERDRDMNMQLDLKLRGTKNEIRTRAEYLIELNKRENEADKESKKRDKLTNNGATGGAISDKVSTFEEEKNAAFAKLPEIKEETAFPEDDDIDFGDGANNDRGAKRRKVEEEDDDDDDDDDDSSDDDSEDHEALMRELEKIKKEKEADRQKEEAKIKAEQEEVRKDKIGTANPILSQNQSLKRRWDEDTVFKDQLRTKPKEGRKFINDNVRTEFHRRFMNKYVSGTGMQWR